MVIPQAHVLQRRGVAIDVGARQPGFAGDLPLFDAVERKCPARGLDVVLNIRGFPRLLVRTDDTRWSSEA